MAAETAARGSKCGAPQPSSFHLAPCRLRRHSILPLRNPVSAQITSQRAPMASTGGTRLAWGSAPQNAAPDRCWCLPCLCRSAQSRQAPPPPPCSQPLTAGLPPPPPPHRRFAAPVNASAYPSATKAAVCAVIATRSTNQGKAGGEPYCSPLLACSRQCAHAPQPAGPPAYRRRTCFPPAPAAASLPSVPAEASTTLSLRALGS